MQGTRVVAQQQFVATSSFETRSIELTPGQIGSITDYHDLRLRVRAGRRMIVVSCCPVPVPDALTVTFSGGTLESACLNGQQVLLEYSSNNSQWEPVENGVFAPCGMQSQMQGLFLRCESGSWKLVSGLSIGGSLISPAVAASGVQCNPVLLTFTNLSGSLFSGTFSATVAE